MSHPEDEEKISEACSYPRLPTEVSDWEYLTLSEIEKVSQLLRKLARRFSSDGFGNHVVCIRPEEIKLALDFFCKEQFHLRPEVFFEKPTQQAHVCEAQPIKLTLGEVFDISFHSHFQPKYPEFRQTFERIVENHTAHARIWRHSGNRHLGTVVAIHGWSMGDSRVSALTLLPGFFFRLGLNVVLYELPYHGRRAGIGAMNAAFPSPDVGLTNEAFAQAVFDLRAIKMWLSTESTKPVGVAGISLGAYTGALWSALDALDFSIFVAPFASLSGLAWDVLFEDFAPEDQERFCKEAGVTRKVLREAFRVNSALSYVSKTAACNRLMLASREDKLIPPRQVMALHKHWPGSYLSWLPGDHLSQIAENIAHEEIHDFLLERGLAHANPLDI